MPETRARQIYGWSQRLSLAIAVSLSVTDLLTFRTGVTAVGCTLGT